MKIAAKIHIDALCVENVNLEVFSDLENRAYGYETVLPVSMSRLNNALAECDEECRNEIGYGTLTIREKSTTYVTGSGKAMYSFEYISPRRTRLSVSGYRNSVSDGCIHVGVYPSGINLILWSIIFNKLQDDYRYFCSCQFVEMGDIDGIALFLEGRKQEIIDDNFSCELRDAVYSLMLTYNFSPKTSFLAIKMISLYAEKVEISSSYNRYLYEYLKEKKVVSTCDFEKNKVAIFDWCEKNKFQNLSKFDICHPSNINEVYDFFDAGIEIEKYLYNYLNSEDFKWDRSFPKRKMAKMLMAYPFCQTQFKNYLFGEEDIKQKLSELAQSE